MTFYQMLDKFDAWAEETFIFEWAIVVAILSGMIVSLINFFLTNKKR